MGLPAGKPARVPISSCRCANNAALASACAAETAAMSESQVANRGFWGTLSSSHHLWPTGSDTTMIFDRRQLLGLMLAGAASPALGQAAMSSLTAYAFSFESLKGEPIKLADYSGKTMLIVNTASLCGFTPQYAGLQELWTKFGERGLVVIGVPSNDFGHQEPGGEKEISETAHHQYGVSF